MRDNAYCGCTIIALLTIKCCGHLSVASHSRQCNVLFCCPEHHSNNVSYDRIV